MNDKFTDNNRDEDLARKLDHVAGQTHVNAQFAAELEKKLRGTRPEKAGWFTTTFRQVSPALRWAALMVLLALVLSWSIRTLVPAPQPAANTTPTVSNTGTAIPEIVDPTTTSVAPTAQGGYDFRGAKLFLNQPLPESPATAHVYMLNKDEPATEEQARALADRFGVQGEMYTTLNYVYGTSDYLISDGKQSLQVHSDKYFIYTADMAKNNRAVPAPTNKNAEATIRDFLAARGFDFPFRVYPSSLTMGYAVQPLAPDSLPMQNESFIPPMMRVVLDENGEVLTIDAGLMNYDTTPVGEYGIITAQEAFDKLLDDYTVTGKIESMISAAKTPREWYRQFPDNQPVTIYGYLSHNPALDSGKPPMVLIDGVPLTGNISGLESLENATFLKASGQYTVENGIRRFNVESWDRKINQTYVSGVLSRQGDQIVLTSDQGGEQYPVIDPPADVPLDTKAPNTQLSVTGVLENGKLAWTYIQYLDEYTGGGGGGGGGLGFYKLNLSGAPVPFPSPTPHPETTNASQFTGMYTVKEGDTLSAIAQNFGASVEVLKQLNGLSDDGLIMVGQTLVVPIPEPTEQKVEDLRGYLSISIHNKTDGTSTKEYDLEVVQDNGASIYTMEGSVLSELDPYNGLPILITGTINTAGKLVVDSYKIPYPDLHFQVFKGTQTVQPVGGQNVTVFTTEAGTSYVEFLVTNHFPNDQTFMDNQGDLIEQEVLILPDETFGGMPVAHVYRSQLVQAGAPAMEISANQMPVYNEPDDPFLSPDSTPPNLTIDQVELVYFVSNPYYQVNDPNYEERSKYMQPVWRFHGYYDNGSQFEFLIQALKQEFLLPELAPSATMG